MKYRSAFETVGLGCAIFAVGVVSCAAPKQDSTSDSATPVLVASSPSATSSFLTEELLPFPEYHFQFAVPVGWIAAPDSAVARIRSGFDPRLMSEHRLVALVLPQDRESWDDVPSIRVLVNTHVNTEPQRVLASLRKGMPTLQESTDSIVKLAPAWRSFSIADPLWDSRRNTLWTVSQAAGSTGGVFTLGAARMYRGGQISIYFNTGHRADLDSAYRLMPALVDALGIPKRLDW